MKIAVDLDGVCYEWDRTARYMLKQYRGAVIPKGETEYWDYLKDAVSKQDWRWLWDEGVDKGLFRYGHMVKDARVGLEALVAAGHSILVVTHRPASAISDTVDWLSYFFRGIPIAGLHVLSNGEDKWRTGADVLVDDKPQNIVNFYYNTDGTAILFDRPWNRELEAEMDSLYIAKGWREVVRIVGSLERHARAAVSGE